MRLILYRPITLNLQNGIFGAVAMFHGSSLVLILRCFDFKLFINNNLCWIINQSIN